MLTSSREEEEEEKEQKEVYWPPGCLRCEPSLLKTMQAQIPRVKNDRTGDLELDPCLCPAATNLYSSPRL